MSMSFNLKKDQLQFSGIFKGSLARPQPVGMLVQMVETRTCN